MEIFDRLGEEVECVIHLERSGDIHHDNGPRGDPMIRTIEATIDEQGNVKLLQPVKLPSTRRALVTMLEDASIQSVNETTFLSEPALAKDWNRPEEDAACSYLQQGG